MRARTNVQELVVWRDADLLGHILERVDVVRVRREERDLHGGWASGCELAGGGDLCGARKVRECGKTGRSETDLDIFWQVEGSGCYRLEFYLHYEVSESNSFFI